VSDRIETEVVVVGLGALGSATAWQLARRGVRVVGLERYDFGHGRGASHGDSRNLRMTYHTPAYVSAARDALQDWADLEADSNRTLVQRCGGVKIFPKGTVINLDDYTSSLQTVGVGYELLDSTEARRRWPALEVPSDADVLYQNDAGLVPATLSTLTLQERARVQGADLQERFEVADLREVDGGVEVRSAEGRTVRARRAVVTVDAWTNRVLAPLGVRLPLTITREHVVHFAVDGPRWSRSAPERHTPGAFPMWTWMDDPSWYGFPTHGEASVKVGQDFGGQEVDPDTYGASPDPDYIARMREFVAGLLPGAGEIIRIASCLYTLTPDRDFVIGPLPGHPDVLVGLGSAHAFKFAPWFGRVLADLVTSGETDVEISAFDPARPALSSDDMPTRRPL
jgi:sarcosine oxidase